MESRYEDRVLPGPFFVGAHIVEGKRIHTHVIPIEFETPSRIETPRELKLTREEIIAVNLLKTGALSTEQIVQSTGVSTERIGELEALFRLFVEGTRE